MKIKKYLAVMAVSTAFLLSAREFVVPYAATAPVVDGVISPAEWKSSLAISGAGDQVDARKAELLLSWDESNLYGAVRVETPPRGKLVTDGGTNPVNDDSVEFWFDPPKVLRTMEQWKFGEFQMILSHNGRSLLAHHNPGYGLPRRNWITGDMKVVNKIQNDQWVCEFSIPAKAFGMASLNEFDLPMLACVNFRSKPQNQVPFLDVASFMDSKSYPVFKLKKTAPAVRQTYAGKSRYPLAFESDKSLTYEAEINGTSVRGTLPVKLNAAAPAKITMTVKDGDSTVFKRSFRISAIPERIWDTPESYIVLEQDFEDGIDKFLAVPENAKAVYTKAPSLVEGRKNGSKAVHFEEGATVIRIESGKIPVPGNLSFWIKKDEKTKSGYVRYFSTKYEPTGYFGLQDHPEFLLLFMGDFQKKSKDYLFRRRPNPGVWSHVSFNIQPQKFEFYCDGILISEQNLPFVIDPAKLGDFQLGGGKGFAIDDYVIYSRNLTSAEIKALAQGEKRITGDIAWYPSLNSVVLDLLCNPKEIQSKELMLRITTKDGKNVYSAAIPTKSGKKVGGSGKNVIVLHEAIKIPSKLAEGQYLMSVCFKGEETPLMESDFTVKYFEWQNNQIGKKDILLPGFTALKVKGNVISSVLRDHKIGASGLPEQIVSMGKEILAAPVTVNFEKNGKVYSAKGGKSVTPVKLSDTAVEYSASGKDLQVKGRMEQDGLLKLDLTFPANLDADRVYVDIPVKKEYAELYHAVGEHIRANPAGFVPSGNGTVFQSRNVQQVRITNFIPYLWLGTDTRGICYAADWDKDWVHCKERDAVELYRHKNGDVSIRLNLINAPVKYNRERTITIALLASPVKPMPEGWRGWADTVNCKGTRNLRSFGSPPYWGGYTAWSMRYPAFKDFGYVRKLTETVNTGVIDRAYINNWLERLKNAPKEEIPWILGKGSMEKGLAFAKAHTEAAFHVARELHGKEKAALYFYTCDADRADNLAEYPAMKGEWGAKSSGICGSYTDYAIYYLDKMLEAGMRGVYDDNTFFRCNYSWATGDAYIDEEGEVKPGLNLWNSREYHRRQVVTQMDRGIDPWVTAHHTNAQILPTLGFLTNCMGMEWKYGVHDFQERFTPDYIRAVCQGLQGGLYPTSLDGVDGGTKEQRLWTTRTMLACLLPHEIRVSMALSGNFDLIRKIYNLYYDFGTWEKDCVYTAYWNPENPVKSSDEKLLTSTYQRGKKWMIVCGSYTGDVTAELTCSGVVKSAVNMETGEPVEVQGNKIKFPLKKHDFILVEATME